jgi:hypothetical protein
MRHESHNGEGIGYAETTFSELTLGHLARHMGTRGTRKSISVAADSVRGQMRHIGLRPQVMMRLGPSSSEHDKSSPGFQDLAMPLFVIVVFLSDVGSVYLSGILGGCPQRELVTRLAVVRFAALGPRAVRLPGKHWRGRCNRHRTASLVRDLAPEAILYSPLYEGSICSGSRSAGFETTHSPSPFKT